MYKKLFFIAIFCIANFTYGQNLTKISNSICRTDYNQKFECTAFCIKENNINYYLLSAGHCVSEAEKKHGKIQFLNLTVYHNGIRKRFVNAIDIIDHIYESGTLNDISLLSIKKAILKDYAPLNTVEFTNLYTYIEPGKLIWTYGSPDGGWPTAAKGIILKEDSNNSTQAGHQGFLYYPPAKYGRSGSPIYDEKGEKVIGMTILTNRIGSMSGPATSSIGIPSWKIQEFLHNYNFIFNEKEKQNE